MSFNYYSRDNSQFEQVVVKKEIECSMLSSNHFLTYEDDPIEHVVVKEEEDGCLEPMTIKKEECKGNELVINLEPLVENNDYKCKEVETLCKNRANWSSTAFAGKLLQFPLVQGTQEVSLITSLPDHLEDASAISNNSKKDCDHTKISGTQIKYVKKVDTKTLYGCNQCPYRTYFSHHLDRHVRTHDKSWGKPLACNVCNYRTAMKSRLNRHLLTHGNDNKVKLFVCDLCGYRSGNKYHYERHILIHVSNSDELFFCLFCEYTTHVERNLKSHLASHNNKNKSHSCHLCGYKTSFKNHLKEHLLTHETNRVKLYACSLCQFTADNRRNFERHVLMHESNREKLWTCNHCEYRTDSRSHLERHSLKHESNKGKEVKTLACHHCNYVTDYKGNLNKHVATHDKNRNKPLMCKHCNYRTDVKGHLQRHLLSHDSNRVKT